MKNKLLSLSGIFLLSLTSCSGVHHEMSDYILEHPYHDNFRILQLTDTHISDKDDQYMQYEFIDSIIKEANPDMIIVTGDLFTFASRLTAERYFEKLDSYKIPWTVTFGNHDEQCYFSIDWMTKKLNTFSEYCLFKDNIDDDVFGNCNFAINLTKDGKIFEQLIMMDSNRYYYGDYFGYDCFKEDQIAWYKDLVDYTTAQNGGTVIESLMFYHIPLPEINEAWEKANDGSGEATLEYGEKRENCCPPEHDYGFFDVIVEKGSTKAMFFGHDHRNNFRVKYKDIVFSYGIKSDNRIYFDGDMLGGQVITIKNDHSLEYEQIYRVYGEEK